MRWPNQPPTHGIDAHEQEAIAFFKMFPDQHLVNNPYKIMIAQGEWTCTVADFTGTMKGPMTMPDGTVIPADEQELQGRFLYGCTLERTGPDLGGESFLRPDGHAETNRRDAEPRTRKVGITSRSKDAAAHASAVFRARESDECAAGKPLYAAVGGYRSGAPETQGNSFCVGALVHSGCCRDGKRFCVVFGGNPVCQLRARLGNHSARERACCTISTRTLRVSPDCLPRAGMRRGRLACPPVFSSAHENRGDRLPSWQLPTPQCEQIFRASRTSASLWSAFMC